MKSNILGYILLFNSAILVLIWGCATQSQPTGGPKDKDPPKLLASIPADQSLNYKGNTIELEYDEVIEVKDLKELIITPRIDEAYDFKIRKEKVVLIFEEGFKDSTTYTFNFRNSIKDITEGNSANTILSFSTGAYLDSGTVSGKVKNLLTSQSLNNVVIGLYEISDTLNLFTGPPLYFTISNKSGNFDFRNIRYGTYYLYGFKDSNNNLTCQPKTEMHGFLNRSIVLDSTIKNITLPLQLLDVSPFDVISSRQSGRYYTIKFNKSVTEYSTQPLDTSVSLVNHLVDQNKTLKIYHTFEIPDSLGININALDSAGNSINDTIYIKFQETSRGFDDLEVKYNEIVYHRDEGEISTELIFSKPISNINRDSIYLQIDSLTHLAADSLWTFDLSENNTSLKIKTILPSHIIDSLFSQEVHFAKAAFISVEQDSSLSSSKKISVQNSNKFGIIHITVKTDLRSFIVQLLDKDFKVVSSRVNLNNISFKYVKPGEYKIRVLFDENNNGKWDAGNFYRGTLPEKSIIFQDPETKTNVITVRANWELGPYIIEYSTVD